MNGNANAGEPDVVLIGAGIMSATLGTFLKELEPSLTVAMFETLHDCAQESSDGWNNAGTGHAANCELNYTPQRNDGSVDISKALKVNTEFDLSRQLWSFLVNKGAIPDPGAFIHACPHMSFVWGAGNVAFLRQRFKEMSAHHCFYGLEYSQDRNKIADWAPLIMHGRDDKEPFAATRIITGSDVDYGALTHLLVNHLSDQPGFDVHFNRKVVALDREHDGRWRVSVVDTNDGGEVETISAKFVFIGAGGGALPLLQKSKIPEGKGYGGFPVSGLIYLSLFPANPLAMIVLLTIGTLLMMLLGRRDDIGLTAITTAVVLIVAASVPQEAWQQPLLRLIDTIVGVAVGVACKWIASFLFYRTVGAEAR